MVSMEEKRKEADNHHQSQREERMEVERRSKLKSVRHQKGREVRREVIIKEGKGGDVKWL